MQHYYIDNLLDFPLQHVLHRLHIKIVMSKKSTGQKPVPGLGPSSVHSAKLDVGGAISDSAEIYKPLIFGNHQKSFKVFSWVASGGTAG